MVWRGKEGTEYAGQCYLSMRGTEGVQDFISDWDLALNTAARAQIVDMVNWWLKITTSKGQSVQTIDTYDALGIDTSEVIDKTSVGTGELAGLTHIQVNGHSLGGHLASAFARIFGGSIHIDGVTTFNSAGFFV